MRIRPMLLVASVLLALLPFASVASAATNEDVIAMQQAAKMQAEQQANLLNDIARCKLATSGQPVPGTVAFSQPIPTALSGNSCTPASLSAISGTTSNMTSTAMPTATNTSGMGCVTNTRSLTNFEMNEINNWAIAKAAAVSNGTAEPAMPAEVAALIGAC